MDEIFRLLASPGWWLSTVVAALIISMVAAYLKPVVDQIGSRVVKSWSVRTERLRAIRLARIAELANDAGAQAIVLTESNHAFSRAIINLILAFTIFFFGYSRFVFYALGDRLSSELFQSTHPYFYPAGALVALFAVYNIMEAAMLLDLVRDARRAETKG